MAELKYDITKDDLSSLAGVGAAFVTLGEVMVRDTPADMERPEHPENYPQTPVGRVFQSLARKESSLHD